MTSLIQVNVIFEHLHTFSDIKTQAKILKSQFMVNSPSGDFPPQYFIGADKTASEGFSLPLHYVHLPASRPSASCFCSHAVYLNFRNTLKNVPKSHVN